MEGDGMSAADKIKEADWRLFRSRLPIWQEAYMERLNREYIALLSRTGPASETSVGMEKLLLTNSSKGLNRHSPLSTALKSDIFPFSEETV